VAANDFDPEDEDELKKRAAIVIRPTVPIPTPRPAGIDPATSGSMFEPPTDPSAAPTFGARYGALPTPYRVRGAPFDPVENLKPFPYSQRGWEAIEDRRNEEFMPAEGGGAIPTSSLQEWGYWKHPEMRPGVPWTPPVDAPSTPMAHALGRDEDLSKIRANQPVPEHAPGRDTEANMRAASKELNLTQQERALYQRHLTNLWGPGGVDHPDGSRSTLYQTSIGAGNRTYNIPTVWEGKILPPMDAFKRAQEEGLKNFPSYNSPEEAQARYDKMHEYMDRDVGQYKQFGSPWSR